MAVDEISERLGIDPSAVDLHSIVLPDGENMGIVSDDENEDDIEFDDGAGCIIVVDNIPKVPKEKFDKLQKVIRNYYSQIGVIKEDGLRLPVDECGKTLGYCFIEFNTLQEAQLAEEKTNGHRLDKSHVLSVNLFEDFEKCMKVPEEWIPPERTDYKPGENLQYWLMDIKARDQFVIRAGSEFEVFWNDARRLKPDPVYKHSLWTESYIQWSPLGTYLATLYRQGAALRGGASNFTQLKRFAHRQVKFIDWSNGENYLVTYSSHEPSNPSDTHRVVLNIFDVRTNKLNRDFKGSADDFAVRGFGGVAGVTWPVFKWGGGKDDKYFAKIGKNIISVYETETFTLIGKKSIKIECVMDFTWSPTDPIIALFVPELGGGNQPARVSLIQIPSKQELRQKLLLRASDCKMYWQSNGEYLALKVERCRKSKKSTYTGFELFRIKECDIPIEVLELDNKNDKIIAFAWEPKGQRFAIIHGDNPKPDISFYTMRSDQSTCRVTKLTTLKGRQANDLFWSPGGHYIVLAGLKGFKGQLEFYNVDELETMTTAEHFMATGVEWDPTGRYVATVVTSFHEMENGFTVWSFYGKMLYRISQDHLFQFAWRPRPPSLLSPEKEEEIAKNFKRYSKKYKAEDRDVSMLLSEQDRERRRLLNEEWDSWNLRWRTKHEEEKSERQQLRDGEASDEEEGYESIEVEVEEIIRVAEDVTSD